MRGGRPAPLHKPNITTGAIGQALFFNHGADTPRSTYTLTPGLTPASQSGATPPPFGKRGAPWIIASPSPCLEEGKQAGNFPSALARLRQTLRRHGLCATLLSCLFVVILLIVSLGAYALLVYLAVTTKKPKYIALSSFIGSVLVLIACVIPSGIQPTRASDSGRRGRARERTESEEVRATRTALGFKEASVLV